MKNHELLRDLPFYNNVNILRKDRAFKNYAETYDIEIINNKNLSDSLVISKPTKKDRFSNLLRYKNGFKYVLTSKISLKKHINNNEPKDATISLNSLVKMVINQRYHLNDSFEEILNLLDIWINEGSGWVIDKIEGLYINVANYEPLLGGSYIPLPKVLNNSMKGLINLKNKDHKCFMWCHVRLVNPTNSHPERINKQDKKNRG